MRGTAVVILLCAAVCAVYCAPIEHIDDIEAKIKANNESWTDLEQSLGKLTVGIQKALKKVESLQKTLDETFVVSSVETHTTAKSELNDLNSANIK